DLRTLTGLIGERPLAVIPIIPRAHETRARTLIAVAMWLAFASVLAAFVYIGQHYTGPLSEMLRELYY
ncbi:MAG: hypothetical protein WBM40_07405, partial [Thiohalocapsa sp.]